MSPVDLMLITFSLRSIYQNNNFRRIINSLRKKEKPLRNTEKKRRRMRRWQGIFLQRLSDGAALIRPLSPTYHAGPRCD
ncbi:hypothetical protein DMZ75_22000 [Salmonella enterica subsp. diarizonae]|nr:hypothetical protein [Salmonella enterica]ECE6016208.1 hypothetical protein [Salmonella enterica subsp. diarizonae]